MSGRNAFEQKVNIRRPKRKRRDENKITKGLFLLDHKQPVTLRYLYILINMYTNTHLNIFFYKYNYNIPLCIQRMKQ